MKNTIYKPKTKWAGMVWIWGNTLNKIPEGGNIEIVYDGKSTIIPRDKIKGRVVKEKKLYNKLTKKQDTQYGFVI